jgi:hypothetical protein
VTSIAYEKSSVDKDVKKMLEYLARNDHEGFDSVFTPEKVFSMWKSLTTGNNRQVLLRRFCSLDANESPILPSDVVSFADAYVKRDLDPASDPTGCNGHGALLRMRSVCNNFFTRMGISNKWHFQDNLQTIGTGDITHALA